ncbi:MAG: ABC transporter permease [Candidatus Thorarchaeota archaeon]
MRQKVWFMAREEMRMVFKSRQVRMIPILVVIMSVAFGGLMTWWLLSMEIMDAFSFSMMMNSIMGAVVIMLPVMLPILIAADSIVGEKERHTLVPLLATPLSDGELLLAKFLTALIPGLLVSYGNLALAVLIVNGVVFFMAPSLLWIWPDLLSLVQALLLPILFSILAVGLMVIISGRADTVYEAYQTGGVLVLPAMVFAYSGFFVGLGWTIFIIGALILIIVDIILFRVAVRLFNRDDLITRTG